jgi:hypothetical protein
MLFLIFVYFFTQSLPQRSIKTGDTFLRQETKTLLFIKYFVFILVITNFSLISTIGVHELSHVVTARLYDCESRSIFYEQGNYPYSEIVCDDLSGKTLITLSGPIIPVLIGIILFFIGGILMRAIALLVMGFNLIASYKDFYEQ